MRIRMLALTASALLTAAVLTGCAATTQTCMEHGTSTAPTSAGQGAANAQDEMFVQMMIPHHQQAIEMADLILGKTGIDPEVTALAEQIKAAQGPEITRMQAWLADWGIAESGAGHDMGHGDGMMSGDDMTALDAADGAEASRLFLEQMIQHHQGAIDMAETEVKGGAHPDVLALGEAIIGGQTAEIDTMRQLLAED